MLAANKSIFAALNKHLLGQNWKEKIINYVQNQRKMEEKLPNPKTLMKILGFLFWISKNLLDLDWISWINPKKSKSENSKF